LSRLDIDAYSNLKEIIESHDRQDDEFDRNNELEKLQKKWECNTCSRDFLRLVIVPRLDGNFYFRRCGTCHHKTKLKKYDENIEGIDSYGKVVKKGQIEDK
jgi:transcription elongation factor Elf1